MSWRDTTDDPSANPRHPACELEQPVSVAGPSLAEQVEKLSRDRREGERYAGRMEAALEHIRLVCRLAKGEDDRQTQLEVLDVIDALSRVRDHRGSF